jgi:hypothetical protein
MSFINLILAKPSVVVVVVVVIVVVVVVVIVVVTLVVVVVVVVVVAAASCAAHAPFIIPLSFFMLRSRAAGLMVRMRPSQ